MAKVATAALLLFVCVSEAKLYPLREGNLDVITVNDHEIDFALKQNLINNAKKTIEISSFFVGPDKYGVNILKALRNALSRGVKVRVMYEGNNLRLGGDKNFTMNLQSLITDPSMSNQAQVIALGVLEKMKFKLELDDCIHQKLLIVDGNTADEKIYFGGRDLAENFASMIDTGFLLRPIDWTKPYLGTDIKDNFELTWKVLDANFSKETASKFAVNYTLREVADKYPSHALPKQYVETYSRIAEAIKKTPSFQVIQEQSQPRSAQLATNEFIIKRMKKEFPKVEDDDGVKLMVEKISAGSFFQSSSYSAAFSLPIKKAMLGILQRGGKANVYTNGPEAMAWLDSVTTGEFAGMGLISFTHTIKSLQDVEKYAGTSGILNVFAIDREKTKAATAKRLKFLHRKLIMVDNNWVMTGSHNFTVSSSTKNDELVVVFDDERMNTMLTQQNVREEAIYYNRLNLSSFTKDYFDQLGIKIREKLVGDMVRKLY